MSGFQGDSIASFNPNEHNNFTAEIVDENQLTKYVYHRSNSIRKPPPFHPCSPPPLLIRSQSHPPSKL